jgi:hypothetical protein
VDNEGVCREELPWVEDGLLSCTRTRLLNRVMPATGKHFRSHSRTRQFNSARTFGSCNSAALFTCCDAIKSGLPLPPVLRCASNPRYVTSALITLLLYSYSFPIRRAITVAFASPSFLPARRPSCILRASEFASSIQPLLRHQRSPWRS